MRTGQNNQNGDTPSLFGNVFGVLMTLAFVIVTIVMVPLAMKPVSQSIQAKSWEEVPAIVTSNYVDGRANQYMVRAEYTYTSDGQTYSSNRIFFDEIVGLRRKYYHRISRQLSRHDTPENPINIWVNPDDPQQAVIFRDIKWDKLLFRWLCLLPFAFFGFGALWEWVRERREIKISS